MEILKRGSKGPEVTKWQNFLKSRGYRLNADGYFGRATDKATAHFQKRNGLTPDGDVGEQTWKLMEQPKEVIITKPSTNSNILEKGSFGEKVKQWQQFLQSAGYRIPYVDGAFGPETERETLKFQVKNGLKPDGVVGPKTWSFITRVSNNTPLSQKWPKQNYNAMVEFYGPVGENIIKLEVPYTLKLAWAPQITLTKVSCNQKVAKSLYTIFEKTLKAYGDKDIVKLRLDSFGGCVNVRKMRGGSAWSIHSWGAAVDLDPDRNQLKWGKDRASFAKTEYNEFWKIVESEGWTSLGRARNFDWMHFQAAYL